MTPFEIAAAPIVVAALIGLALMEIQRRRDQRP